MLNKDPGMRFASVGEVALELDEILKTSLPGVDRLKPPAKAGLLQPSITAAKRPRNRLAYGVGAAVLALLSTLIFIAKPWEQRKTIRASRRGDLSELPRGASLKNQMFPNTAVVAPKKYLATTAEDQKNRLRRFCFPKDKSLGQIGSFDDPRGAGKQAIGTVLVPETWRLVFRANLALVNEPILFDGFGENDLYALKLDNIPMQEFLPDLNWSSVQMTHVAKLTGLRRFECNEADIDGKFIASLNKLPGLEGVIFQGLKRDASILTTLERLPVLEDLRMTQAINARAVINKLVSSKAKVRRLDLGRCNLTDDDMEKIAKLKNLQWLDIADNENVGDRGLEAICSIKTLNDLVVDRTKITSGGFSKIENLTELKALFIDDGLLSKQALSQLNSHFGNRLKIRCKTHAKKNKFDI